MRPLPHSFRALRSIHTASHCLQRLFAQPVGARDNRVAVPVLQTTLLLMDGDVHRERDVEDEYVQLTDPDLRAWCAGHVPM